jgi:hypothetical protein
VCVQPLDLGLDQHPDGVEGCGDVAVDIPVVSRRELEVSFEPPSSAAMRNDPW